MVTVADVNQDGVPDVIWQHLIWQEDNSREVVVWFMSGALGNQSTAAAVLAGPTPGWRALMAH